MDCHMPLKLARVKSRGPGKSLPFMRIIGSQLSDLSALGQFLCLAQPGSQMKKLMQNNVLSEMKKHMQNIVLSEWIIMTSLAETTWVQNSFHARMTS
eukprot:4965211-Amphidinium_carterae.1